jgi:hypothetical protein
MISIRIGQRLAGYGSYCKICQHEHYKQRYHFRTKILKQKWQPFQTEYRDRNKQLIIDYLLSHPCVDCGEDDLLVLEFDHVRGVKIGAVGVIANGGASVEKLKAEIAKCEVRCANCHRRRTVKQLNWLSRERRAVRRAKLGKRGSEAVASDVGPEYSCLVLAPLAQLVEQLAFNQLAAGSSPAGRTKSTARRLT